MHYRRVLIPGGTYFITVATAGRQGIFADRVPLLRQSMRETMKRRPFTINAMVVLPDHWHMILTLPEGDADLPLRISGIKRGFTNLYLRENHEESAISPGAHKKRYRGVWQSRYWEHLIRDTKDLRHHVDYIHINPLKHGYVDQVIEWPWSSFHRFLEKGHYEETWAGGQAQGFALYMYDV